MQQYNQSMFQAKAMIQIIFVRINAMMGKLLLLEYSNKNNMITMAIDQRIC